MQTIIVFVVYFIFFNWLISRIRFIKQSGLNPWWIHGLFSLKIIAGLAYAWFYLQPAYYSTSDTWNFFELSKFETDLLLKEPLAFFKDIFAHGYQERGGLFSGNNSYWNDLKSNSIIKLLAICNVFTGKNYYANLLFFNFIFFFGPVALFRIIKQLFDVSKMIVVPAVFLLPSFLFWCSGIHKDGLIFTALAIICFHFHKQLLTGKLLPGSLIISLVWFIILFALRNFMALLLLPALAIWFLCENYPGKSLLIIICIGFSGIIFFFISPHINPNLNFPRYIIEKQAEFKQLSGSSSIEVPPLENNITSFIRFLPTAIDIAFFRPHITEIKNKSYIPAVAEIFLLWGVAIFSFFRRKRENSTTTQTAFILFCVFFSLSFLLLAGYTITFSGAIVRYRAVILPFLFTAAVIKMGLISGVSSDKSQA